MERMINFQECPNCKGVMMVNCCSGEEYKHCQRCGYHIKHEMKCDNRNQIIFNTKDQKIIPEIEETIHEGHGTYLVMTKEGIGQGGGFFEPITDETINQFKDIFSQEEIDENASYLIRFENKKAEVLLGKPDNDASLSYVEFNEKQKENRKQKAHG